MKEFWNQRYSDESYIYGKVPDTYFVQLIKEMKPGKVLLPGEGEGRHAVYAARHGWEVTAFDFSEKAKEKAMKLATDNAVFFDYHIGELEDIPVAGAFDFIALFYLHLPPENRRKFHRTLQKYLVKGGKLLLKGFSKEQISNHSGGPKNRDMLYDTTELRNDFDKLNIKDLIKKRIELNEGEFHKGEANIIYLLGEKLAEQV